MSHQRKKKYNLFRQLEKKKNSSSSSNSRTNISFLRTIAKKMKMMTRILMMLNSCTMKAKSRMSQCSRCKNLQRVKSRIKLRKV